MELVPGKETSEFKSARNLAIIGFGVAALVSLANLDITPEIFQLKLNSLSTSAKEWTEVLAVPIAFMQGAYSLSRGWAKSKQ